MADASFVQSNFTGGEVSHFMQGRVDLPAYRTWLNTCLNSIPLESGAWVRRPGTRFGQTTRNGLTGRLIKFDFQQNSPYQMEFTDGNMRFYTGPTLVTTNDSQTIVSISAANPAVVQTALPHGWSTGNQVMFSGLGAGCALLQNRQFLITVVDTAHFSLQDPITLATIDGSTLTGFVSGTVARVLEIATPYLLGSWSSLRSVQAERQAVLLQGTVKPQVITATPPAGASFATFALAPSDFKDGPYLDPIPTSIVTPSAQSGVITLTFSFTAYDATVAYAIGDFATSGGIGYKSLTAANQNNTPVSSPTNWAVVQGGAVVGPNGFVSSDIGRLIRLLSEPSLWNSANTYSLNQVVAFNGGYWVATGAIAAGVIPGTSTLWAIATNAAQWTWGQITAVSATGLINPALAGSAAFGSFTSNLNAAFDGVTSKAFSGATGIQITLPARSSNTFDEYVGKNYSGASAQVIDSAIVYGTSDIGLSFGTTPDDNGHLISVPPNQIILNLRAKHTAPLTGADGVLLGTSGVITNTSNSVAIQSGDKTTAWEYVWIDMVLVYVNTNSHPLTTSNAIAQVQFYTPNVSNGSVVSLQIRGPALLYSNPVRTWRLGAFSGTSGYPTCGTYHEGRLWLSGAIGNRIDSSKSNDLFNFAPTNVDGSVSANNAISYIFDAPDVNQIFWLEPDLQGIIAGTQAGEWLVIAPTSGGMSPLNIAARRVTKIGCANIEPRRTEHTIVAVQKFARKIFEYFADVFSGKFTAPEVSLTWKHLTAGFIQEIAYQQELAPIVWSRVNGQLRGCTYRRDSLSSSQGPTMAGGHRHALGSGRAVESISVGPSTGGNLDALSMVTNDPATSIRHIEVLTDLYEEGNALGQAWYLDDAVVPTSTTSSSMTPAPYGGMTLNGLWHLNGKTVQVFCAGLDLGQRSPSATTYTDFVVANGSITIPYGDGVSAGPGAGLFINTLALAAAAAGQIVVGFAYNSDGQIVRPNSPAESGARNGPAFAKKRRGHKYGILVEASAGMSIGTDFAKLMPIPFKDVTGKALAPGLTYSGVYKDSLTDDYSYDGMIAWRASRVMPANVMAIGENLATQDE
jgi:hypothetical protein